MLSKIELRRIRFLLSLLLLSISFPSTCGAAALFQMRRSNNNAEQHLRDQQQQQLRWRKSNLGDEDEPDGGVHARLMVEDDLNSTSTIDPQKTWGLDRLDGALDLNYSTNLLSGATGAGVRAYIIDSGIQLTHYEFTSHLNSSNATTTNSTRVTCGKNFRADLGEDCNDEWGHGTFAAALIGGRTFGVAKEVELVALKVFAGNGTCRFADVIAAIDFVIDEKTLDPDQPMVINLSLATARIATILNDAVDRAVKANITVVVAAGNGGVDACTYSPASSDLAITVAASTREDTLLATSNWGNCVDVAAPGERIWSAWIGPNDNETLPMYGTSAATPYVTGAAALYLEHDPYMSPAEIKEELRMNAVMNFIEDLWEGDGRQQNATNSSTPSSAEPVSNFTVFVLTLDTDDSHASQLENRPVQMDSAFTFPSLLLEFYLAVRAFLGF